MGHERGVRPGVGNGPVHASNRCFDPFSFPSERQRSKIVFNAEELDAHRKRVLVEHPHFTLTSLYNVLEKLRAGARPEGFDAADHRIFEDGLVLILTEVSGFQEVETSRGSHMKRLYPARPWNGNHKPTLTSWYQNKKE
jgi:hypothetical protein